MIMYWRIKAMFWVVIAIVGMDTCLGSSNSAVLILNGTGSAGKTTLAESLYGQLQKIGKRVEYISWDSVAVEAIKSIFKKDSEIDVKLAKAILFQKILQRHGPKVLGLLLKYIKKTIIKRANDFLVILGSIVVIDMTLDTQEAIDEIYSLLEHDPLILHVLIYCSLPVLLTRVIARNSLNVSTEKRDILHVLESRFMKMYMPQQGKSRKIVDSISRKGLANFVWMAKNSVDSGLENKEMSEKFDNSCARFAKVFGLTEQHTVSIVPCFSYDLMVNNGNQTSQDSAAQITNFLANRYYVNI